MEAYLTGSATSTTGWACWLDLAPIADAWCWLCPYLQGQEHACEAEKGMNLQNASHRVSVI